MDIKLILKPENVPRFRINCYFPLFHGLLDIYTTTKDKQYTNIMAYNNPDNDANYNELCAAVSRCNSGCSNLRKVVSHIFGRNKTCTKQIPDACTIKWCRQHYQRFKYRSEKNFIHIQIDIIRRQLDRIERWGGVTSWTIVWGKSKKKAIDAENAVIAQRAHEASHHEASPGFTAINRASTANPNEGSTRSTGFLLPYIGTGKTLDQVRATVDAIERWAKSPSGHEQEFPKIEFLPIIDEEIYPPAGRRKRRAEEQNETGRLEPHSQTEVGPSSSPTVISVGSLPSATSSTAVEWSSSPTIVSAPTSSVTSSFPRRNPARRVKRSASDAFEDEATIDDMTIKTNSSTKRCQPQRSRPIVTSKAAIGRKGTRAGPARK